MRKDIMSVTAQEIVKYFVTEQKITQAQADALNIESINTGISAEELLRRKKFVSESDMSVARAKVLGIPFVSLASRAISPDALNYISEPVARKYSIIPFELDSKKNVLSVALVDPLDLQVIEFLEKKSGKSIQAFMATAEDITATLDAAYTQNLGEDVSKALKESAPGEIKTYEAGRLGEVIREAPIAQIVSAILEQAIKLRASDVHIEPQIGDTRMRLRVDGILQERLLLPRRLHDAVISRIKILAQMKIDERRVPQDGRFNFKMGESEVDLRVSTLPTVHGEKIVMRLLKKSGGIPSLADLGLRGLAMKNLESSILRPHGIIIVAGPTGSGKTSTLYSVLSKLNTPKVNILTLEDPVEYEISGVNQVQINPAAGLSFATGLRSFLRQDPNIILVGEIRDRETTELAIQAALTGHLVFSTLHTNNASGVIARLFDLGAEPFLVASALNAVVGQRIVRRICPSCKAAVTAPESVVNDIHKVLGNLLPANSTLAFFRGTGKMNGQSCATCSGSGYSGRVGIFEVFPVSGTLSKVMLNHGSTQQLEDQAVAEGMITLKQDGYLKVIEGITTLEEVLRVAQD